MARADKKMKTWPQGSQWMSESERELWSKTRGLALASANGEAKEAGSAASKIKSKTKLGAMLLAACEKGNEKLVAEALDAGASPNERARGKPRKSALTVALERRRDGAALVVLRAGGWCAPDDWGGPNKESADFDAGVVSPDMRLALASKALEKFLRYSNSWETLAAARDLCEQNGGLPARSDEDLASQAFAKRRYDLASQARKLGVELTEKAWEGRTAYGAAQNEKSRSDFLNLMRDESTVSKLTALAAHDLFKGCVQCDDSELLLILLDAGARPSADWTLERFVGYQEKQDGTESSSPERMSLVWASAGRESGDLLEILKRCEPAMAAARAKKESPWAVSQVVSILRVMEMREAGLDISGVDKAGRGLAHVWAMEKTPRDGWATLLKKAPEVFDLKDKDGFTGADKMAQKLQRTEKDAFLASISRMEKREMKSMVALVKSKKNSPAKTRRL